MKHKAQKSLKILSYPPSDSSCGGCKCGTSDCDDCKNALAVWNLEELINCQLTPKELTMISRLIEKNLPYLMLMDKKTLTSICNKLSIQNEMWVSEDDY